jgi:hypothetical protein
MLSSPGRLSILNLENFMRFLLLFLFLFTTHAHAQDFIVIVNKNSPLKDADMELIKEVYLGEKKFAGSTRFLPVSYSEGPLKDVFLKEVLGMNPKEYKHHCLKRVFREGLTFPSMGKVCAQGERCRGLSTGLMGQNHPVPGPEWHRGY